MHADNLQVHKIFVAQFEYYIVKSLEELKVASIILQLDCQYVSTQMKQNFSGEVLKLQVKGAIKAENTKLKMSKFKESFDFLRSSSGSGVQRDVACTISFI
jgi:hypothetical protein